MSAPRIRRRFAVLGGARTHFTAVDQLCLAIQNSDRHELILPAGGNSAGEPTNWRVIAEDDRIEAVIVCSHDDATLEAARQLAMRGKSLVIEVAATLPAEFVAEMALYDAEGESTLRPWMPWRWELTDEARAIRSTPLGTWQSIQIERSVSADAVLEDSSLTRLLLIDIDWMRLLGGDYSQVTCIRIGGEPAWVSQTLQLAGDGLPDASCVYRRQGSQHGPLLRVDGTDNSLVSQADDDELVRTVGGVEVARHPMAGDGSSQADHIRQQLDELWQDAPDSPRWRDVVRLYEIQEAMQRSLKRRRTIDLHFETTSERSQFKTHMAAIGCGVILWTMLGVIGLLFAGAVLDPRDGLQRESEAAGFVLPGDAFVPGTSSLTEPGQRQLQQIAAQMSRNETVVYVEASASTDPDSQLDDTRRLAVQEVLAQAGIEEAHRVVVRPLRGQWFARLMQLARILVFAPVGLFLMVQALLVITRPAAPRSPAASQDRAIETSG